MRSMREKLKVAEVVRKLREFDGSAKLARMMSRKVMGNGDVVFKVKRLGEQLVVAEA